MPIESIPNLFRTYSESYSETSKPEKAHRFGIEKRTWHEIFEAIQGIKKHMSCDGSLLELTVNTQ